MGKRYKVQSWILYRFLQRVRDHSEHLIRLLVLFNNLFLNQLLVIFAF